MKDCTTCGVNTKNVGESNWNDMHGYHFPIYPNDLYVVTNADRIQFEEAVETVRRSHDSGTPKNIDDVLRDMNFIALCGEKFGTVDF